MCAIAHLSLDNVILCKVSYVMTNLAQSLFQPFHISLLHGIICVWQCAFVIVVLCVAHHKCNFEVAGRKVKADCMHKIKGALTRVEDRKKSESKSIKKKWRPLKNLVVESQKK